MAKGKGEKEPLKRDNGSKVTMVSHQPWSFRKKIEEEKGKGEDQDREERLTQRGFLNFQAWSTKNGEEKKMKCER